MECRKNIKSLRRREEEIISMFLIKLPFFILLLLPAILIDIIIFIFGGWVMVKKGDEMLSLFCKLIDWLYKSI